jgi:hypothetical protein
MIMVSELELTAEKVIAAACLHISKENNADAAQLVQMFLNEARDDGHSFSTAMEALARGGIAVALMAAELEREEAFSRIIFELGNK